MVTAQLLTAGTRLRIVARAGVEVDNIDVDAATSRGILVVNSPYDRHLAAAEHTIALLLASARHISREDAHVKRGHLDRRQLVGVEVGFKTLGIIGLGKIGMKVARMAIGLGMTILGFDPSVSPELAGEEGVTLWTGRLEEMLPFVDFLTFHPSKTERNWARDLLGYDDFKLMKKTARVLNVARDGIYNEMALLQALDAGIIAGAGIDVFTEPHIPQSPAGWLAKDRRVVATSHLGVSTVEESQNMLSLDVATKVVRALSGRCPGETVNMRLMLPGEYLKLQPFVSLMEKMGSLFSQHFVVSIGGKVDGRKFEVIYPGELASISNTRPLLTALIKGLTSSTSGSGESDVNTYSAQIIAEEKGISISETHAWEAENVVYKSGVTLQSGKEEGTEQQVIEGFVSGPSMYIRRLDRFKANFVPDGNMLLLRNHDEPGKIADVSAILGSHEVDIKFIHAASLVEGVAEADQENGARAKRRKKETEGLMIVGVGGDVTVEAVEELRDLEGIIDVNMVKL